MQFLTFLIATALSLPSGIAGEPVAAASLVEATPACSGGACNDPRLNVRSGGNAMIQTKKKVVVDPPELIVMTKDMLTRKGNLKGEALHQSSEDDYETDDVCEMHAPLCSKCLVKRACAHINDGITSDTATWEHIKRVLSATSHTVHTVKHALALPDQSMTCLDLCSRALKHATELGHILPDKSDIGCYKVGEETTCDVELDPGKLGAKMATMKKGIHFDEDKKHPSDPSLMMRAITTHPTTPSSVPQSMLQSNTTKKAYVARLSKGIKYTSWELTARILNLFHIYPATHAINVVGSGGSSLLEADVKRNQAEIAQLHVQAKGWVNSALNEMDGQRTASFRETWFDTSASTRQRILDTLNFVIEEIDTMQYVFPASPCQDSCRGSTGSGILAFVCQYVNPEGYHESRGPICDGSTQCNDCCAINNAGGRVMYFCQRWFDWPRISHDPEDNVRIGTIVHEAIHHTGPGDVTYTESVMKQLPIRQQLDNAASYENFVQDVAANAPASAPVPTPPPATPQPTPPPATPQPTPPPSAPQGTIPSSGVQVLDGGSGNFPSTTCVTDASQTRIGNTKIAAQCCAADGTCQRYVGSNNAAGCIAGKPPNVEATTFAEATQKCVELGLQLCETSCKDKGCNYNNVPVWTKLPCSTPSPPAEATSWCQNGFLNGNKCCAGSCGRCGGSGCGRLPGGRTKCCLNPIRNTCTTMAETACIVPPAAPAPSPPATSWCQNGFLREDTCCAGSCGRCGGSGCGRLPGGYRNCCLRPITRTCTSMADEACKVPQAPAPTPKPPTPAPTPKPPANDQPHELPEQMQATLDQHNLYRCMHGLQLFEWDEAIAANAQAWADRGHYGHSSRSDRNVNGQSLGENLAWGYPQRSGLDSTIAWYSEIEFTRNGLADGPSDSTPPGEAIGHYTQIVWRTSVKLGCGVGKATVNNMPGDYWVCQYGPAGNYIGQFTNHVNSPVKSEAECGGGGSSGGGGGGGGGSAPAPAPAGGGGNGGSNPAPAPAPAPAGGGGNGGGTVDYENCVPEGSVGTCDRCTHNKQCSGSMYCCPYMKLCVPSSSHGCSLPVARCSPTCHERSYPDMADCKRNCEDSDFPESWLGTQCPGQTPTPAPPPPTCEDKAMTDQPIITGSSGPMPCSQLGVYCSYEFVRNKCPATCDACP